jgi:uncharacterized membrane protein
MELLIAGLVILLVAGTWLFYRLCAALQEPK